MKERPGDLFLGGRISVRQPGKGFRSGIEAVMLAAAVPAGAGGELLELGCGAGIASLCVAARISDCRIIGVDIVPELVELACANARDNGMERSVTFLHANVLALPKTLRRGFTHVFCNPPFHDDARQRSPNHDRALALHDAGRLGDWLAAAQKRVRANGTMTAIIRADRLAEALCVLACEGIRIFPLWRREGEPAKRVILQLRKSSRAPLALLSGLVLHDKSGRYTKEAEEILRNGASLALANRRL